MSIVTKTGDKGQTGVFGAERASKAHPRFEAVGAIDELNAMLGLLRTRCPLPEPACSQLHRLQNLLFTVGADLATPIDATGGMLAPGKKDTRVTENHVSTIERWIEELEEQLPALQWFILPGGSEAGATLHLARTICRRAERRAVALKAEYSVNPQLLIFLNRLGDYLFLLARAVNRAEGVEEERVRYE